MKDRYILRSDGVRNQLIKLPRKDGEESKTFMVKTSSTTLRKGKWSDGSPFIDLLGGPSITVGKPLAEADNAVVRSIDLTPQLGYTVTFV